MIATSNKEILSTNKEIISSIKNLTSTKTPTSSTSIPSLIPLSNIPIETKNNSTKTPLSLAPTKAPSKERLKQLLDRNRPTSPANITPPPSLNTFDCQLLPYDKSNYEPLNLRPNFSPKSPTRPLPVSTQS